MKKYYYSWKECLIDIQKIARQVSLSEFSPDVIVGVSRGGLVPATEESRKSGAGAGLVETD